MTNDKCFLYWKIHWSLSGYKGWDHDYYIMWLKSREINKNRFKFVYKTGFGFEWWNFYEDFDDNYYYGYGPPIHSEKHRPKRCSRFKAIFFVSRNPFDKRWYLIGIYGICKILNKEEVGFKLLDLVPREYLRYIAKETRKELESSGYFLLKAPKRVSFVLPKPMPLKELPRKFRFYTYIDDNTSYQLLITTLRYLKDLKSKTTFTGNLWFDSYEALNRLKQLLKDDFY